MSQNRHPYEFRLRIRERLPWFLINLGIADKGKDCEKVGAEHVCLILTINFRVAITARCCAKVIARY